MAKRINDVLSNLKRVDENQTSLQMLMEFEKVLDNANIYAYRNWMEGELVSGPNINRYWFTTTWMYPLKVMPDPNGALRLLKYGCKVYFEKDTLLQPVDVKSTSDIDVSKGSRRAAKIEKQPVWMVTIEMPRRFVDPAQEGTIKVSGQEIDLEDIQAAWDEDLEKAGTKEMPVGSEYDAREADFDPDARTRHDRETD